MEMDGPADDQRHDDLVLDLAHNQVHDEHDDRRVRAASCEGHGAGQAAAMIGPTSGMISSTPLSIESASA
jgi:hypothetical protein